MSFQEAINVFGVDTVTFLQGRFQSWVPFFMTVTKIGDPSLAFTFYFPAVCALSVPLGLTLLWTLIFCEWGNMILKWVLAGDRPYWWVHESPYYLHKRLPNIRQYPVTCETGPGMPSGHSTLNAALFFILSRAASSYLEPQITKRFGAKASRRVTRLIWALYCLWLVLVMTSRIIIGAHFPHQCFAGVAIGILTSLFVSWKKPFQTMNLKKSLILTGTLLSSVGVVFGLYKALGNNPMWSINKAIRWCARREFIHVDSSPFYALSRYAGQALGLGLALSSSNYGRLDMARFTLKMQVSQMVLSLTVGQCADFMHRVLPSTMTGYYVLEFLLNVSLPYLIVCLLPWFIMRASRVKPKPKSKKP